MKHKGAYSEMIRSRDEELYSVYRHIIEACSFIDMDICTRQAIEHPAKRFYVSDERAYQVVCAALSKGKEVLRRMHPMRREMYEEILSRVSRLKKVRPADSLQYLTMLAISQPAPKFYLSVGTAKVILTKEKKKWFERRRKQLHSSTR